MLWVSYNAQEVGFWAYRREGGGLQLGFSLSPACFRPAESHRATGFPR